MSLSKTEVMGEYQSYMGKRALFFLILLLGTALLASMAVTLGSASLSIKEVYVAIMARFLPDCFESTSYANTIVWGHRFLLPGSALVGALLLLGSDTLARTILAPVILPVGIMTSFLGVPFFVYLFMKRRKVFW